jgi:hypothetical protein
MYTELSKILKTLNTAYNNRISVEDLINSLKKEVAGELVLVGGVGALTGLIAYGAYAVTGYILVIETTVEAVVVSTTAITGIATLGLGIVVAGVGAGIWAIAKASWKRKTAMNELCEIVF